MNYFKQLITNAGVTLDNSTPLGQVYSVLAYTTAPVTLLGNVVINPTVSAGADASFSLRWEANITLSTFSVVIAGITMAQDQVNQNGTFSCYYDGTAWSVQYFADGKDQPQAAQGVTNVPVPVGGTLTLTAGVDAAYQRLTGPVTLTSAYTVIANTGVKAGSQFQIEIAGPITLNGNALTVFGISINANQALTGGVIILATFDGVSTWVAASTSRPVSTADITPMVARTVMGNATNTTAAPTDIAFPIDFGVLQRNGTALTTGLLTADNFDVGTPVMELAVTSLSSAQILASFATPIKILDTVANYAIIHNIVILMTGVTPYATNTDAVVYFQLAGVGNAIMEANGVWAGASGGYQMFFINNGVTTLQIPKASDLYISTPVGNPSGGTRTAEVLVYYTRYN
jgi:hypothetical protein